MDHSVNTRRSGVCNTPLSSRLGSATANGLMKVLCSLCGFQPPHMNPLSAVGCNKPWCQADIIETLVACRFVTPIWSMTRFRSKNFSSDR